MKPQERGDRSLCLQTGNNRWKWMVGATAATTTGITAAQAGFVTINLAGNFISATEGNHLTADLTGDGHPDLTIANAFYSVRRRSPSSGGFTYPSFNRYYARVNLNGVYAGARFSNDYGIGYLQLGAKYGHYYRGNGGTTSLNDSIPISFQDLHINGGARTKGSLDVTVSILGPNGPAAVQLDSFTYNTADRGSSLALLAMGAGGILALRRWRTAGGFPRN